MVVIEALNRLENLREKGEASIDNNDYEQANNPETASKSLDKSLESKKKIAFLFGRR